MKTDFASRFAGGAFVAAATMLWLGWMLMPTHLGTFFEPDDFARVHGHLWWWIWMFRVYLFGMVVTVIALFSLGPQVDNQARSVILPGIAVASGGTFVSALAAAFYYHFGAWGAIDMQGKSALELQAFVDSLRTSTEYVTCLVRFGRVFTGLGLVVLGFGLWKWNLLPAWLTAAAMLLGLAAMALTMALPDHLSLYMPIFHLNCLWLATMGVVVWREGLG